MAQTRFSGPVASDNGFIGNVTGNLTGNVTGVVSGTVVPTTYTLATLPLAVVANQIIVVTDANSGAGTVCFGKGSSWIDVKTGVAVA